MTDKLAKTKAAECLANTALRELHATSVAGRVMEDTATAMDLARYVADRFNGMRVELSLLVQYLKGDIDKAKGLADCLRAVSHGDYGLLITGTEINKKAVHLEVEDAGQFAETIKMLLSKRTPETRMQACAEVNKMIADAIKGWTEKIRKMKNRSSLDGSSQGELAVAEKKVVQFNEAVRVLQRRGGQVSEIYYDAKKQMTDFLKKMDDKFRPINYMEDTGKVKQTKGED